METRYRFYFTSRCVLLIALPRALSCTLEGKDSIDEKKANVAVLKLVRNLISAMKLVLEIRKVENISLVYLPWFDLSDFSPPSG